jgi:hypothetical protein
MLLILIMDLVSGRNSKNRGGVNQGKQESTSKVRCITVKGPSQLKVLI